MQKTFDTVDHDILLKKLKALGFDPLAIKWFESYLKSRKKKLKLMVFFLTPSDPFSASLQSTAGIHSGAIAIFIIYNRHAGCCLM